MVLLFRFIVITTQIVAIISEITSRATAKQSSSFASTAFTMNVLLIVYVSMMMLRCCRCDWWTWRHIRLTMMMMLLMM